VETLFDGGKLITGNGSYTGTVTFAWMLKLFGNAACGAASTISVPADYSVWTVYKAATSTQANCITQGTWIWSSWEFKISTSTLVIDAAEAWVNGMNILNTSAATIG